MAQPSGEVVENNLWPMLSDLAEIFPQILGDLHITERKHALEN
jgi:hypothetical protein